MEPGVPVLPAGLWAIASDLESVAETEDWLQSAGLASVFTLRRPRKGKRIALQCLQKLTAGKTFVALHGMADLALAGRAHAVIAGVRSLPLTIYRNRFPNLLLGASCHTEEEVESAFQAGADFLLYGPVWDTPEKQGILEARGLSQLEKVCRACKLPVVAIGGVQSREQVVACRRAGAHAVAVLRAAKSPSAMAELWKAWQD